MVERFFVSVIDQYSNIICIFAHLFVQAKKYLL